MYPEKHHFCSSFDPPQFKSFLSFRYYTFDFHNALAPSLYPSQLYYTDNDDLTKISACNSHPVNQTLTHWGPVTHICVGKLTITSSDKGLLPRRRQAIIWTNAGILLIGPLGTNFSDISRDIQSFSFKKMHLKMPSAKWRPFCFGPNVLNWHMTCISHNEIGGMSYHEGSSAN